MSLNIYEYTVLDLATLKTMTYAESMKFTGKCVFLNESKNYYTLLVENMRDPVLYFPISIKSKRLNCFRI